MVANDGFLSEFVQQILFQSPILLVHLVGLILSFVWMRRAKLPAILCMLGCGLTIFAAMINTGLSLWLRQRQMHGGMPLDEMLRWMLPLTVINSLLRALGASLIIAAVFVRRTPPQQPFNPARAHPSHATPEAKAPFPGDNPEGYRSAPKREGY
ncbi:MAG: hypothetical protein U0744_21670 [Gemmataceae bacterium]